MLKEKIKDSIGKRCQRTSYRNTTSVSCDILKANKLIENGHDNYKRKELILKVLRTEDLLTMATKKRQRPRCSDANPSGYSARKMITDEEGDHVISDHDQFLFAHDFARLYVAVNFATSESLQFLFPEATSFGKGVALWDNIVAKIFGTTYKDALDAVDKLQRWSLYPSKHLQHDLHHLMLLVKRANETSKSILSETSVLSIMYDAISKDPREELRMISS